jgi:hypothetical protein
MLAAGVSISLMIVAIFKYGLGDDPPPTTKASSAQAHARPKHSPQALDTPDTKHMGSELAPLQVWANAQVGDWVAYRVVNRSTLFAEDIPTIVLKRITAVTDETVMIEHKGRMEKAGDRREQWTLDRPRQGLTLDKLVDNDVAQWRLVDVVTTDDTHEVNGRAFKSKKITYAALDPLFPSKRVRVSYWYSGEIPAGGLVEARYIQDLDTLHMEQINQVIGFGTATATTWGTKPEGF